MRTTLTIDDAVLSSVLRETGEKSPVAAIRAALDAYLKQARKDKVLALMGTMDMKDDIRVLRDVEVQAPWGKQD